MKINQLPIQGTGITRTSKNIRAKDFVEPGDSVELSGNKPGVTPSLSSLSSRGVSREYAARILTQGKHVEPMPLESLPNVMHKTEKWQSNSKNGTFSTTMVYSPVNDCYYTGMMGKNEEDKSYGRKYLTALNTDGSVKWTYEKRSITADPAVDDKGNVYLRSQDHLTALDKDGKVLWECEALGSCKNFSREELHQRIDDQNEFEDHTPQPGPDGTVYILAAKDRYGDEGGVTAVKDGKVLWCSSVLPSDEYSDKRGPVLKAKNGSIYFSGIEKKEFKAGFLGLKKETLQRDVFTCLNPDGSEKFKIGISDFEVGGAYRSEEIGNFNIADDGSIYLSAHSQKFSKYSPDGEKLWDYNMKAFNSSGIEQIWLQGAPVPKKNGNVIFAANQRKSSELKWKGYLVELDPDGKEVWKRDFKAFVTSEPKIAENDNIYLKSTNDNEDIDNIHHFNNKGILMDEFTINRKEKSVSAIPGFTFGKDNTLAVETLQSEGKDTWNHTREIMLIPIDKITHPIPKLNDTDIQEAGKIEKSKDFIVINGVRVPVNKK